MILVQTFFELFKTHICDDGVDDGVRVASHTRSSNSVSYLVLGSDVRNCNIINLVSLLCVVPAPSLPMCRLSRKKRDKFLLSFSSWMQTTHHQEGLKVTQISVLF